MARELNAETFVIGSGLAGFACAVALKRRGRDVQVLSRDGGATSVSSGAWDFGPLPLGGEESLEEMLASERWKLLYARISSRVPTLTDVQEIFDELKEYFSFSPRRGLTLPTSAGLWKRTFIAQTIQAGGDLAFLGGKKIGLVAGKHWRFDAARVAGLLGATGKVDITPYYIDFPGEGYDWPLPHLATRAHEDLAFRNRLRDALSRQLRADWRDCLLFPPLFLSPAHAAGLDLAVPYAELLSTTEPVAGERLARMIRAELDKLSIPVHRVGALTGKSGEKKIYAVESGGDSFAAERFVLATGKFFGGGVEIGATATRETVFGLPLFSVRSRGPVRYRAELPWMERAFADEQPWAAIGPRVDDAWRPLDDTGAPIYENLAACGSLLTGIDLARNGLGLGFAAFSGRECGRRVE